MEGYKRSRAHCTVTQSVLLRLLERKRNECYFLARCLPSTAINPNFTTRAFSLDETRRRKGDQAIFMHGFSWAPLRGGSKTSSGWDEEDHSRRENEGAFFSFFPHLQSFPCNHHIITT